jgi:hypothetical protein
MKLGSLKNDTCDGALIVVSKNLRHARIAYEVAPTLQAVLDDWDYLAPQLKELYDDLNRSPGPGLSSSIPGSSRRRSRGVRRSWDGKRLHLPLTVHVNDKRIGAPDRGVDMQFDFPHLIAHAAKTRRLGAGTVLGSGTVSNHGHKAGQACIAEIRAIETVEQGKPATPYLKFGDRVRIEMFDPGGQSIFGAVDQQGVHYDTPR